LLMAKLDPKEKGHHFSTAAFIFLPFGKRWVANRI
jgi:hypothetical protein